MLKLIVAYKTHDLFSEWDYVTREVNDTYALEYLISKHRQHHEEPEYFKKLVYSKLNDDNRQSIQELGDLEFDALIFVEERRDLVELRYQDETIHLSEFKTKEEKATEKYNELEQKYCRTRYLENREELDEFLAALEVFDDIGNFDDIEVLTYTKEDIKTTKNFPILAVLEKRENFDWNNDRDYTDLHFTLVDSSLGR